MDIHHFKKQLSRYLKSKSNETETAVIEAWYKSYRQESNQSLTDESLERIRLSMQQQIGKVVNHPSSHKWNLYRVAATVLLLSAIGTLTYLFTKPSVSLKTTFVIIQTQTGQVKQFILPDSSVIWVNAASKVRVPSTFNDSVRQVYLDEGEAFFEVKHNRRKPFRVQTIPIQVQVLGTSFNIKAYHALPKVKVTVSTGRVGVSQGKKLLAFLTPGKQLTYTRKGGSFTQQTVTAAESQSWKDGDTYLNRAGFNELALIFKNMYNINLKAGNKRVHSYLFTLRIKRSLRAEEVLKVISMMHNAHYRKEGSEVVLF